MKRESQLKLLDPLFESAYELAFNLSLSDKLAQKIVIEAINLVNLRLDDSYEPHQVRILFFESVYRSFLSLKTLYASDLNSHEYHYYQSLDPMVRGCLFARHRLELDFDDIATVFQIDRYQAMNQVNLGRRSLIEAQGLEWSA